MAESGGAVDFESMDDDELDRFLQERYDAALKRLNENTPRCLDGFTATPTTKLDKHPFDGHGSPTNKIYALACRCGGEGFSLIGHHTENRGHAIFVSPLALLCAACNVETNLIDTDEHGYDAENESGSAMIRAQGERGAYACGCGGREFRPYARFEYPPDILEDSIGDWIGNEHNLFLWFSLVGDCAECGKRVNIAEFETA